MAVQLVTGQTGDLNVTSENQGAFNAAVVGGGQYVMTGCECKMASATKLHVGPGVLCVNGRNVHIDKQGADVAIEAGATGKNRNDVVCVRYKRAGSAQDMRESVELVVVKGTPVAGEAKDPAYTSGSVLDGAAVVDMPLCRVPIKGIVPGTPEMMSPTVPSLAEMWDSVSRAVVKAAKVDLDNFQTSSTPVAVSRVVAVVPTYVCHEYSDRVVVSGWDEGGVEVRAGVDQYVSMTLCVLYV